MKAVIFRLSQITSLKLPLSVKCGAFTNLGGKGFLELKTGQFKV
jgi:hypothetical protein